MIKRLRVWNLAGVAEEFSSPDLTWCADSYLVSVLPWCYNSGRSKTPVILTKVQVAGHTYICIHPWPKEVWMGTYQGNELTCNSSGKTWPQLSQLTEPLWTDTGLKGRIRVRKLISFWLCLSLSLCPCLCVCQSLSVSEPLSLSLPLSLSMSLYISLSHSISLFPSAFESPSLFLSLSKLK